MIETEHKQKVLIVHNYYQIPGGEDTVVANEKRLLEEHGHEVVLYSRHNNELKSMSKLQRLGLPFTTLFNPRTYRDIKKIIKDVLYGPSILLNVVLLKAYIEGEKIDWYKLIFYTALDIWLFLESYADLSFGLTLIFIGCKK